MVAASTPIANRPDCLDILEAYDAKVTGEVKGEVRHLGMTRHTSDSVRHRRR